MAKPIVFIDIAGPDDDALKGFYSSVFDWEFDEAGGSVDVPRFEVPGVVVLGLFRDPAGNPMGLVEMDGNTPVVP